MILIDAEKEFHKIQHPLMIKILKKLGTEGKFLNTIKGICEKSTANIIHNVEDWIFSTKIRNKTRISVFTTST